MGEARDLEDRPVFFLGSGGEGVGTTLVIGLPAAAWEGMKDGQTSTIGLRKQVGLDVIIFGAPSRAKVLDALSPFMKGQTVDYRPSTEHPIPEDERQVVRMRAAAREWLCQHVAARPQEWDDALVDDLVNTILRRPL